MKMQLSSGAEKVYKMLKSEGFKAYFVGGSVRDSLMGLSPYDFDIATDASTAEMLGIFSSFELVTSGIKHGTVGVITESGIIECTTFRVDGEYLDSRHPESVRFSRNLSDDLSRRDFTVNALAYDPDEGLTDLFGGKNDLESGILKAIGEADKRFHEDALRILRGMRFSATLGFAIESETAESMKRNAHLLRNVSKERITSELQKLLTGKNFQSVLNEFSEIFEIIIPGCKVTSAVSTAPADFETRLFVLTKPLGKIPDDSLIRLSAKTEKQINDLFAMNRPESRADIKQLIRLYGKSSVKKYILYLGDETLIDEYEGIISSCECCSLSQLDINGKDLLKLGLKGRDIGKTLDFLLTAVINGETINSKNELIRHLETMKV